MDRILGESNAVSELRANVVRVARSNASVLVLGENGSGKEGVARAIHTASSRSAAPYVTVNCASVTDSLLEDALFGHEKGAFTGAVAQHRGFFEQADGGTLLLDEIGDMPVSMQAALLRVLETGEFVRVGGKTTVRVDVRLISSTNKNLRKAVAARTFREDLYHRISALKLVVPPLRERGQDASFLATKFLANVAPTKTFSVAAKAALDAYAWPGNIRELGNIVNCLQAFVDGDEITEGHIQREFMRDSDYASSDGAEDAFDDRKVLWTVCEEIREIRLDFKAFRDSGMHALPPLSPPPRTPTSREAGIRVGAFVQHATSGAIGRVDEMESHEMIVTVYSANFLPTGEIDCWRTEEVQFLPPTVLQGHERRLS